MGHTGDCAATLSPMGTSPAERDTSMSVRVDPSDVVRLEWAPGLQISKELAEVAMRAVDELNDGRERPLYVDMTGTAVLTRDARKVFTAKCSASRIALVGRSAVDKVLANFSLSVSTVPVPTRFFTSEPTAIDWLCDGRSAT